MLQDYGIPVVRHGQASTSGEAVSLADSIGYPVVMKTAADGILHKSEVSGVRVNIQNESELREVYADFSGRLGDDVLIAEMATIDAEMALGIIVDPQFGPLVMVAGGGIFVEILKDRQLRLAPVDERTALEMIDQLAMCPILDGARGRQSLDKLAIARTLSALSVMAVDLQGALSELDINPLAVTSSGCVAVDVLAIGSVRQSGEETLQDEDAANVVESSTDRFRALVLRETDAGVSAEVELLCDDDLPDGDVLVDVDYSSLNYKDGMALVGKGNIIRSYPMVPGIDFAGTVVASQSDKFATGDEVILTGWSVGERYWGGYTERQRVKSEWLVRRPESLSSRDAMAIGTAGLTSMLCVLAIEDAGITPADGPILVTGAAGGVGSIAVTLLAGLGYEVAAVTGRAETHDYLRSLGASRFLSRKEMTDDPRPLESEVWAAAIDTVGSTMLAKVLAQTRYRGVVAACGLAGGFKLPSTVMPFILRGVRLQGVDSVKAPTGLRERAWRRLATDLETTHLNEVTSEVPLSELLDYAAKILAGQIRGRTVVNTRK